MSDIATRIDAFPITIGEAVNEFARRHQATSHVLYHYTTRAGLEGILRSGGLHATHRKDMNDKGEFAFARKRIDDLLVQIGKRLDLPSAIESLARECRSNFERLLPQSEQSSRGFCACLTVNRDQESQWRAYADDGKGFVLGFNLFDISLNDRRQVEAGDPFLMCAPVIYDREQQEALISSLFELAILVMQNFKQVCSQKTEDLHAFFKRVVPEVVVRLITFIDFFKHPNYQEEREMRMIVGGNYGAFDAQDIKYRERDGVPFLFFNLRNPSNARLPLNDIIIGPNAVFRDDIRFVEWLLDETLYSTNHPPVVMSSVAPWA